MIQTLSLEIIIYAAPYFGNFMNWKISEKIFLKVTLKCKAIICFNWTLQWLRAAIKHSFFCKRYLERFLWYSLMYKCEIQCQIVSVKTAQRNLYNNRGSTTAPACAATGCHSPSASTLLDLCPAAACTVHVVWLREINSIVWETGAYPLKKSRRRIQR